MSYEDSMPKILKDAAVVKKLRAERDALKQELAAIKNIPETIFIGEYKDLAEANTKIAVLQKIIRDLRDEVLRLKDANSAITAQTKKR